MIRVSQALTSAFCVGAIATISLAQAALEPQAQSPVVTPIAHPYPLDICIVSDEELGGEDEIITKVIDGREMRFCCEGCVDEYTEDPEAFVEKLDAAIVKQQLKHYPIDTCIVGKGELGGMGEPINMVHNNRMVRFCCGGCVPKFEADPEGYFAQLDQKIVEAQLESYPLDTCVVGKGELGGMGEPINIVYMNRLVRFCCKGCLPSFKKDPVTYMKQIDAAYAEKQRDDYPLETCVVGGGELGSMGEPIELVAGTRLVRFCCKGCVPSFNKEPQKYLAQIAEAAK